jgi:hypothetical protein
MRVVSAIKKLLARRELGSKAIIVVNFGRNNIKGFVSTSKATHHLLFT